MKDAMNSTARTILTTHKRRRFLENMHRTTSAIFAGTVIALNTAVCFFSTPVGSTDTPCGADLTGSYGVVASPRYPNTYPFDLDCLWHIHANTSSVNATETGVTLEFRDFQTLDGNLGNDLEKLVVYTSDPSINSTKAYRSVGGKADVPPMLVPSNDIWLRFRSRSRGGSDQGSETLRFLIVYLERGADVKCDGDPLQHGGIKTGNGTGSALALQSQVEFQCDWGFRMEGINTGQCVLEGDGPESLTVGPRWSHVPHCVATCEVPASVTNGSFVKSSPTLTVNSTVTYSCDDPYLLNRQDPVITCVVDGTGIPDWNREVPACEIPDCSTEVPLTAAAGALVNPSFPSLSVLGGQKNCRWDIRVQTDMAVNFNISYFDLPREAQLNFLDGATQRVLNVFHGQTSYSPTQRNFNSSGARVRVTYNGPVAASVQHKGFYISYHTVERSVPVVPTTSTTRSSFSTTPLMTSTPFHIGPSSDDPTEKHTGDNSGSSAGAIAGGVVMTVVVLVVAGAVGFCCYRKKYPVRMTVGRTFAKFSNPQYNTPHTVATLVREDASEYFRNQLQMQPENMHSQVSIILGGEEESRVEYVNTAFQYDTHDVDEEEVERRFREQKAYLFKKVHEDETDGEKKSATPDGKAGESVSNKTTEQGKIGLDHGHENEAFVDSDGENGEKSRSGNESDSSSTSSEVVSCLNHKTPSENNQYDSDKPKDDSAKDGTETTADDVDGGQPDIPSNFNLGFNPERRDSAMEVAQGMTVKEFLMLSKEQRALSDVTRGRSGSLPVVDYTKSARRRAQSAGDVFANGAPGKGVSKISPLAAAVDSSTANTEQPEHAEHVKPPFLEEPTVNVTNLPDEESAHGQSDGIKSPDASVTGNDHVDKTVETFPSLPTERDAADTTEQENRSDAVSTASDSDEESSLPSSSSSSGVLAFNPRTSPGPTHEDNVGSSQKEAAAKEPVAASDRPRSSPSTEGEFYFVNNVPQERLNSVSSNEITDKVSVNAEENTEDSIDDFHKDLPTASSETGQLATSLLDASPSSSFVMVPPSGAENTDMKSDETRSRTSTDSSLGSDEISIEEVRSDNDDIDESHSKSGKETDAEDGTSLHLLEAPSQQLSSGEMSTKKKAISVEGLTSIRYSDDSSPSSSNESEAESDKGDHHFEREDNAESQPPGICSSRSLKPNVSESSDEDDSMNQQSQFTLIGASPDAEEPSRPNLPTETPEPLEFSFSEGGSPDPSLPSPGHPQEFQFLGGHDVAPPQKEAALPASPPSPPVQRLRGLAALRMHPASQRSVSSTQSESDGDLEFTTEDVERALMEGGDVSSDEEPDLGAPPPLPHTGPPKKVTLKLDPADTFVFDDEENEDIDV